jgi:hypothetical protein
MEHPRPWSAEDIYNNSVTKKQITEWLQEHASSDFLVAKRLLGRIDNVARVHSKNYLAKCYLEVLQGNVCIPLIVRKRYTSLMNRTTVNSVTFNYYNHICLAIALLIFLTGVSR